MEVTKETKSALADKDSKKAEKKQAKKIVNNLTKDIELTNKDKKEMINIVSILLDPAFSIDEKIKRIGGAPANGAFLKEFKKSMLGFAKKQKIKSEKIGKINKEALSGGILGISLKDFDFKLIKYIEKSISKSKDVISATNTQTREIKNTKEKRGAKKTKNNQIILKSKRNKRKKNVVAKKSKTPSIGHKKISLKLGALSLLNTNTQNIDVTVKQYSFVNKVNSQKENKNEHIMINN